MFDNNSSKQPSWHGVMYAKFNHCRFICQHRVKGKVPHSIDSACLSAWCYIVCFFFATLLQHYCCFLISGQSKRESTQQAVLGLSAAQCPVGPQCLDLTFICPTQSFTQLKILTFKHGKKSFQLLYLSAGDVVPDMIVTNCDTVDPLIRGMLISLFIIPLNVLQFRILQLILPLAVL